MPLFEISSQTLKPVEQTNFNIEKSLQNLIEENLGVVFNCRFIASEFPTGTMHAGRIDTLALSEENNPVIIEYKKVESSELINQSLYYLSWIYDHKGDFEIQVQKALGNNVKVDWSDIRVICIAPNYQKYDLHAVQVMGANIELWTYRLFDNSTIYLEEVLQKSYQPSQKKFKGKEQLIISADKKDTNAGDAVSYTFEYHLRGKPEHTKELAFALQEYIVGLDTAIEEMPRKHYISYRTSQNIICMEIQKQAVILSLKLDPEEIIPMPDIGRDMTETGHWGTGDLELTIKTIDDVEIAKSYIEKAYQKVGG